MADTKISGLTAITTPAAADELLIIDDPGGTALSRKITVTNLLATVNIVDDTTPQLGGNLDANSSDITGLGHVGFLATQDASGGANDLDDYEEGVWTPTIQADGQFSDAESQTYSTQVGTYVKIGRLVFIQCKLVISSLGSLTTSQDAIIAGFPFSSSSTSNTHSALTVGIGIGLAIPAESKVSAYVVPNVSYTNLNLWNVTTGASNLKLSEVSADGWLYVSGCYQV